MAGSGEGVGVAAVLAGLLNVLDRASGRRDRRMKNSEKKLEEMAEGKRIREEEHAKKMRILQEKHGKKMGILEEEHAEKLEEMVEAMRIVKEELAGDIEDDSRTRNVRDSTFQQLLRLGRLTVVGEEEAKAAVHVHQVGFRGNIYSGDAESDQILGEYSVPYFPVDMCGRKTEEQTGKKRPRII